MPEPRRARYFLVPADHGKPCAHYFDPVPS